MALDEPKDNDRNYEHSGITFLVDSYLQDSCGTIRIDYLDAGYRSGFSVTSSQPVGGGGGGCGSSCGTKSSCGC